MTAMASQWVSQEENIYCQSVQTLFILQINLRYIYSCTWTLFFIKFVSLIADCSPFAGYGREYVCCVGYNSWKYSNKEGCWECIIKYTRRYGPLHGPSSSSCGGLLPRLFFCPLYKKSTRIHYNKTGYFSLFLRVCV